LLTAYVLCCWFKTDDGTGGWVKCDNAWIGIESRGGYRFHDIVNFNIDSAKTGTLAVRLNIKIPALPGGKLKILTNSEIIAMVYRYTQAITLEG